MGFLSPVTRKTVTCENRLRFVIRSNPVNTDTEGATESVRFNRVPVKQRSTVHQSLTTTGIETVSLRKSTLWPDEDLQYAVERSRSISLVKIVRQTINETLYLH